MILAILLFVLAVCLVLYFFIRDFGDIPSLRTIKYFNKLKGPSYPFYVGAATELIKFQIKDLIPWIENHLKTYDGYFAFYSMGIPTVIMADPECLEPILTSSVNIAKGPEYDVVKDWLGEGLLVSTGAKWKQRRKMLTPSFHFKILEDSEESINRIWRKVAQDLLKADGAPVELLNKLARGTLDIICETGMGTTLDNDDESEGYVAAVSRAAEGAVKRSINPLLRNDFIFRNTSFGKKHIEDIKYLHRFTDKVIQERKRAYLEAKAASAAEYSDSDEKKRQVFLDSLIELSGKMNLSDADIREEVDTFMFAGHDTTSTAMQFLLFILGEHPDVQEKAYQEQVDIFGYSDRDATKDDLSRMHFMDQVIKEGLRLYPPAPQVARQLVEDVKLPDGQILPAGIKVFINIYQLHRNPKHFPDPDAFKPERFSIEEAKNRHPYSFIPFSAGPRNCIGQKYAMNEMKIGLSAILRSCKISTISKSKDLTCEMAVVLRTETPIRVEFSPRN